MTRDEYEEVKRQNAEVYRLLREGSLTPEEKQKLQVLHSQLSGLLLSPWLPFGWGRRSAMLVLFLSGAIGLLAGNVYLLAAWMAMFCFSPRIVGECSHFLGKLSSNN